MIASSMLDGLTFDDTDERRRCVVCEQMRWDGEDLGRGECVCNDCGDVTIRCDGCLRTYPRREFVAPEGLDDRCGGCAYVRDMANGALQ